MDAMEDRLEEGFEETEDILDNSLNVEAAGRSGGVAVDKDDILAIRPF